MIAQLQKSVEFLKVSLTHRRGGVKGNHPKQAGFIVAFLSANFAAKKRYA